MVPTAVHCLLWLHLRFLVPVFDSFWLTAILWFPTQISWFVLFFYLVALRLGQTGLRGLCLLGSTRFKLDKWTINDFNSSLQERNSILFFNHVCSTGRNPYSHMALFEAGMEEDGWVLKIWRRRVLQGCCPGLCSSKCCPFQCKSDHCPLATRSMGDIVQGLVFV